MIDGAVCAIDPGNNTGVAWGYRRRLVACYLATPTDALVVPAALGGMPVHAVVEYPKWYGSHAYGTRAKAYGIANSLIRESVTLGRWVERIAVQTGAVAVEVLPRTWKGTLPKRAMLRMIWERLDRDERALVLGLGLPKSLVHNVLDAIGLFLWSVGRLDFKEGSEQNGLVKSTVRRTARTTARRARKRAAPSAAERVRDHT